jgi:hypothetical protein
MIERYRRLSEEGADMIGIIEEVERKYGKKRLRDEGQKQESRHTQKQKEGRKGTTTCE